MREEWMRRLMDAFGHIVGEHMFFSHFFEVNLGNTSAPRAEPLFTNACAFASPTSPSPCRES